LRLPNINKRRGRYGKKSGNEKCKGGPVKIGTIAGIATALIIVCSADRISPAYGAADGKPIAGIQCERQANERVDFFLAWIIDSSAEGDHECLLSPP
jgi:hypothetical protein